MAAEDQLQKPGVKPQFSIKSGDVVAKGQSDLDTHDRQRADQGADAYVDEDRLTSFSGRHVEDKHKDGCCAENKVKQKPCRTPVSVLVFVQCRLLCIDRAKAKSCEWSMHSVQSEKSQVLHFVRSVLALLIASGLLHSSYCQI